MSGARSNPTLPSSASESDCSDAIVDECQAPAIRCFPCRAARFAQRRRAQVHGSAGRRLPLWSALAHPEADL